VAVRDAEGCAVIAALGDHQSISESERLRDDLHRADAAYDSSHPVATPADLGFWLRFGCSPVLT
jgi:hypothetical protein